MKQKLLSWLLIVCLCIGVIPTYVLNTKAAEETEETAFAELQTSDMQGQMNQLVAKGYRVVTPQTFGVADTNFAGATLTQGEAISLNKLLFSVNMMGKGTGNFFYLGSSSNSDLFKIYTYCNSTAGTNNRIYLYHTFGSSSDSNMYAGDKATSTGTAFNSQKSINPSSYGVASIVDQRMFQLWITTEMVDMKYNDDEGDEEYDDLKIEIWVDGKSCGDFYVRDFEDITYYERLRTNTNLSISSPILELDDLGMDGGEYTSEEGGAHTTPTLVENKDMNGTTFQSSVCFKGVGGTLYYGSDNVENAVQLTSTADGIQVSYDGEELVVMNKDNVGIDVLNNNFDLKLATEIIDSDVNLDICVDNKHKSFTLKGAAETFSANVGVKTTGDATVLVGDFASEEPEQISWDLENGTYTIEKTDTMTRLSVDGVSVDGDIALTQPGTYSVAITENGKVYMKDVTILDKFVAIESQMPEGYRVVTPLTFGWADTAGSAVNSSSKVGKNISIDKLLFCADLTYDITGASAEDAGGTSLVYYLRGLRSSGSTGSTLQMRFEKSGNYIYLWNYFDSKQTESMYVGDAEGATSKAYGDYLSMGKAKFGLTTFDDTPIRLWITTEFVDMTYNDDDDYEDDLKIGFYINGVLYGAVDGAEGSHFYVPNCKENVYSEYFQTGNARVTMSSPIMQLSDLGMVGGEYTSQEGGAHTTPTLVENKNMNGTTFQSSVRFEGEGGTLYYGSDNPENAVQLTSTADGIQVSYDGEELVVMNKDNVGIDVLNNNFDLKLATEIIDSDVNLDICVDNKHKSFTLKGAAETFSANVGVKTTGDATVLVGDFANEEPEQISWDLENGTYTIEKTDTMTRLSVDGVSVDGDIALTQPGTYSVAITENGKVYVKDVTILDKFAPIQSQMPEGYRVVTPLTFGWADTAGSAVNSSTKVGKNISIDKLLFCADLVYDVTGNGSEGTSLVYYLRGLRRSSGGTGTTLQMRFEKAGNAILLWNNFDSKDTERMYVGDKEGATSKAYGEYLSLNRSKFGLTTFDDTPIQLWITTEFVDMQHNDDDDYEDDLKIGFYINGVLYGAVDGAEGSHFYVPNCKENVYSEYFQTSNARVTMSSPLLEPSDMGMSGGEYASADGEFYDATTDASVANKVMDGTTFQSNIRFEGEGGTLYYGSSKDADAIKLTSTSDGIQVSYGNEDLVVMNKDNVGIDVLNNNFVLKLATKIIGSDVELDICVDNRHKSFTLVDAAETLSATMGVKTTGDATVLVGNFAEEEPKQVYWSLDNGAYTKATTDFVTRISVNGIAQESFELSTPGTYSLAETRDGKLHMEDVTVYSSYDLNGDDKVEVADLVRMKRVEDETTHDDTIADLSEVAKKAIGYKDETSWDATTEFGELVLDFMREEIVGGVASAVKTSTVSAINLEQLLPNQGSHGAYTSDFTITASGLDFLNDIWLLTCKAKYISINGKQPTIEYKIVDAEGDALYTSPAYVVGGENESILRQWRVTPIEQTYYNSLQINFVIPDGVALFIDEFYNTGKDNILAERTDKDVEYASHTGLRYAPANTIPSFEWAGKMGFDRMITIVKFTKDGIPVCFHDDDTIRDILRYKDGTRIAKGSADDKPIEEFTYQYITETFSAGYKVDTKYNIYADETVPTLEEFFQICKDYDMDPIFSVHPALTIEQWTEVRGLLETYGLLDRFYVKTGALGAIEDAFSVLGFDIGGYQIIKSANSNSDSYTIAKKTGLVDASGEVNFDKVEAEFFNDDTDLQAWVERVVSQGFTRISIYGAEKFSGTDFTRFMEMGVNEFNVDYHASMGLNW